MNRRLGLVLAALAVVAMAGVGLFLYFRGGLLGGSPELAVLGFADDFPDAQRPAYFRPFTSETEVRIRETTYDGDYGQLEARLKGAAPPDVVQVDASALLRGVHDGLFLPIDYAIVPKGDLLPQAAHEFGVGTDAYAVALGWNAGKLPEGSSAPKSWADFWDVKKYPGGRSLMKSPRFTLEIALMADGVARSEVYKDGKLDLDRAFRKLDQIKCHVKRWTDAREPIRQLLDREVVMAAARGERLYPAAVELTWNQAVLGVDYWAVHRGTRNAERAMRFIAYANKSDRQATFATLLPLGPVNPKAFGHIAPEFARRLSTNPVNLPQQMFLDARWWDENGEEVARRFDKWLGE